MAVSYRWRTVYGSSGSPFRIAERVGMPPQIPGWLQETVVFLYPDEAGAKAGAEAGASAFIVEAWSADGRVKHSYVVTARHVAEHSPTIRFNKWQGGIDTLDTDLGSWIMHPGGDDVAIFPVSLSTTYKHHGIPRSWLLGKEDLGHFGPGDECIILGRHVRLSGYDRNTPAARFGAVSMVNVDPIAQSAEQDAFRQESVVVEAKSLNGYSGSLVVVYQAAGVMVNMPRPAPLTPMPEWTTKYSHAVAGTVSSPLCVLGLDWGHMKSDRAEMGRAIQRSLSRSDVDLALNSGMMLVVPAWKLIELLDDERVVALRDEAEQSNREDSAVELDYKPSATDALGRDDRLSLDGIDPEEALRSMMNRPSRGQDD